MSPRGERAMVPDAQPRSYYGRPVIKQPVWTPEIPVYFFTGGMGGASAGLAWLAEATGNDTLARRSWGVALVGLGVSPPLLISDLGRPARFLNMLRMFKVTSPMSVGSWVLAAIGPAAGFAALSSWTGALPRVGRTAKPAAAALGMPLATYTAALLANTAIPVWHHARYALPFVFAGSSAMSAGAAAAIVTPPRDAAPARRLALAGAVAAVAATQAMEQTLGDLAEPYSQKAAGKLKRAAIGLTVAGAGVMAVAGRRRAGAAAAGALMLAGAACERFCVFRAGFQSASDPKYTIGPQRHGIATGRRRGAVSVAPV
jgi:formate-dependent nitrite reductase membrane component NrfD